MYNLRSSTGDQRQRIHFEKTNPRQVSIGERRKPQPNGHPAIFVRIDTVHQGDLDKLATKVSGNESARILKFERETLFNLIFEQDKKRA